MIHLYTGDGKGKTTAAIGCAVRSEGARNNVLFVQFMKDGASGEVAALRRLEHMTVLTNPAGLGFAPGLTEDERQRITAAHNHNLKDALACARGGHVEMIVLDEICSAYALELIDRAAVDALISEPGAAEWVLTGRNPSPLMLERADYITEMRKLRHPFDRGAAPRSGVEF